MAGLIKFVLRLLGVLGVLAVLAVIALIAVLVFVDPNDYRDDIIERVYEETGRELTIGGEIGLSFYPKIGLSLDHLSLSNAEGFDKPFAEVAEVEIGIALVPLIRGKVVMDTTRLIGLHLNLGRNQQGVGNWEDLVGEARKEAREEAGEDGAVRGKGLAGFAIGGIEIRNAAVSWDDRQSGDRYDIEQITVTTGTIAEGEPFDLEASFDYTSTQPPMQGRFELSGEVLADAETATVTDLLLRAELSGDELPGGRIDLELRGDIAADMRSQKATIDNLQINLLGIELTGEIESHQMVDAPRAYVTLKIAAFDLAALLTRLEVALPDGARPELLGSASLDLTFATTPEAVTVERFDVTTGVGRLHATTSVKNFDAPAISGTLLLEEIKPRMLLAALGQPLETADPEVLGSAAVSIDFTASKQHVDIGRFALSFDDSRLQGTVGVKDFDKPAIRFALDLDAIDIDRYLPPSAEEPVPLAAAAPAVARLPVETLRALDIDGTLRIGKLKAYNVSSERIELRLVAAGGRLRINPASADLYGGTYRGDIGLDVRGDTPRMSLDETLTGVQVGPLLGDLTGEQRLTGNARVAAKLTAEGIDPEQIKRTLNGTASFAFTDGAIAGINLAQMIREAYAKLKGQPVAATSEPNQTDFTELTGSLTATNGLLENRDLSMQSPLLRIAGSGQANLPTEAIDYLVKASVVGSLQGQGGATIAELKDVTVPVRIRGTFSEPSFSIDLESVLTEQVKQRAIKEVQKVIGEQLGLPATNGGDKEESNGVDVIKGLLEGLFK